MTQQRPHSSSAGYWIKVRSGVGCVLPGGAGMQAASARSLLVLTRSRRIAEAQEHPASPTICTVILSVISFRCVTSVTSRRRALESLLTRPTIPNIQAHAIRSVLLGPALGRDDVTRGTRLPGRPLAPLAFIQPGKLHGLGGVQFPSDDWVWYLLRHRDRTYCARRV